MWCFLKKSSWECPEWWEWGDEWECFIIENYIFAVDFIPPQSDDDAADNAQSSLQQSNNQPIQSQPNTLRDIFSDRTY